MSMTTDDPKVMASAIMIGVPVMRTTFADLCRAVITSTVNSTDHGKIMSRSS